MLSDKPATFSEEVQVVLKIISRSKGPLHEFLNDALSELSNENVFNDLVSNPQFSMEPILGALTSFFSSDSELTGVTIEKYSNFYAFLIDKLNNLSQNSQLALIVSITSCICYCNERIDRKTITATDNEAYEKSIEKITSAYRNLFKLSLEHYAILNIKAFAERYEFVKGHEVGFIVKEFIRANSGNEKLIDLNLTFFKIFIALVRKGFTGGILHNLQVAHLFTRIFIKRPNHADTVTGLGLGLEMISMTKKFAIPEISQQVKKFTDCIYTFICDHPDILMVLIEQNLFHGSEIDFFKSINLNANLHLVNAFKKALSITLSKGFEGKLLSTSDDSLNMFELYFKLVFGDLSDLSPSEIDVNCESYLMNLELFSKLAVHYPSESVINTILRLCSQSYFISDSRHHVHYMNLLKLSLLSNTSDTLGDIFKRFISFSSHFTVANLCLLKSFPFSLWRSLEKHAVINNLIDDLLATWKYLNSNETSIDLLALILGTVANIINEAVDLIKKEDLKVIISMLPSTVTLLRNNSTMDPFMKHKLAVSVYKLLRSLLLLRDDKLFDIIDHITRLGSTESCNALLDSWKSLSFFALLKHTRDAPKLEKIIKDRIEMLIPKLLMASEKLNPGAKVLIQHYYCHALYVYLRFTQDINFFNNPVIKSESDALLNYTQGSCQSWNKGMFDFSAEEAVWNFIYSNIHSPSIEAPLSSLPVQISPSLKPSISLSSALNLIKEDFIILQKKIEEFKTKKDNAALQNLHTGLRALLK